MLILRKIQLRNFLSHTNTEIDFTPDAKMLINGESGAGKSSIVEAIIWCIYGKARTDNRSLVRRGATGAVVSIVLQDTDTLLRYRIERSTTIKGKNELEVCSALEAEPLVPVGVSGIRYLQEFIESKIVKASYLLFINSIAYPQENQENFVKQTAEKRKDIILEIIKATDYDIYYDKAHEAFRSVADKHISLSSSFREKGIRLVSENNEASKLQDFEIRKKTIHSGAEDLLKFLGAVEQTIARNKEIETKISSVMGERFAIEKMIAQQEAKIVSLTPSASPSEQQIMDMNQKIAELPALRASLASLNAQHEALIAWKDKISSLRLNAPINEDFTAKKALLNAKMIQLMTKHVPICPELGDRPCSCLNGDRETRIKEYEVELLQADKDEVVYNEKMLAHASLVASLGEAPAVDLNVRGEIVQRISENENLERIRAASLPSDIEDRLAQISEIQKEIGQLKLQVELRNKEVAELKPLIDEHANGKLAEVRTKIQANETEKTQLETRIEIAKEARVRCEQVKKEMDEIEKELADLTKDREALEAVKAAFSSKGIKAMMVDYVIPQLEDRINDVLHKLSDFTIRLETQRAGATGDTLLEGLFLTIINGQGEAMDLANYSGGEKMKIITAVSEGLASLQKTGFRIFDESITGLDSNTIENFVEVMLAIQSRFNQLLCISHLQQIKDVFDERITVVKRNGTSEIV